MAFILYNPSLSLLYLSLSLSLSQSHFSLFLSIHTYIYLSIYNSHSSSYYSPFTYQFLWHTRFILHLLERLLFRHLILCCLFLNLQACWYRLLLRAWQRGVCWYACVCVRFSATYFHSLFFFLFVGHLSLLTPSMRPPPSPILPRLFFFDCWWFFLHTILYIMCTVQKAKKNNQTIKETK